MRGFLVLFAYLPFGLIQAQIEGIWKVDSLVRMNETSIPMARWFQFGMDDVFAGNGWAINTFGHYEYRAAEAQLAFEEDDLGTYTCTFSGTQMHWNRWEYDMEVDVYLSRVIHYPLAIWDELQGWWQLIHSDDAEIQGDSLRIRFDWDRKYAVYHGELGAGNNSGLWHFDFYQPQLQLISNAGDEGDSRWNIHLEGNRLYFQDDEGNIVLRWIRYNSPPDID